MNVAVGDLLRAGTVGLRTRRLRAFLSALGIAIGIASMVAVIGISESSKGDLIATLDRLGTNLLRVQPGESLFGDGDVRLPEEASAMIGRVGPVEQVTSMTTVSKVGVYRSDHVPADETNGLRVVAAETALLDTVGGKLRSGRFLDASTEGYPAAVLGATAARRLGITRPGVRVWMGGKWFVVAGILRPLALASELDGTAIIGYPVAQKLFGTEADASSIYVRADPDDIEDVRAVLGPTANPERPSEVDVSRPSDFLEARAAARSAFTALFVGLGAVALLVGGVGIANVMVISVLERRSEIGLRRALGATTRHVWLQFLTEALVLAGAGGIAGALLGAVITVAYAAARAWTAVVPPYGVAGGVTAAVVIGAVAGLYPAARAARLSPTDALRST